MISKERLKTILNGKTAEDSEKRAWVSLGLAGLSQIVGLARFERTGDARGLLCAGLLIIEAVRQMDNLELRISGKNKDLNR